MTPWKEKKITIVGSGAIGLFYGARLQQGGCDVHFLCRRDYPTVSKRGIQVLSHDGDFELPEVQAYHSTRHIGASDLVIISTKASDNEEVLKILPPLIHDKTTLLVFQNGLGNEEIFAKTFGAEKVVGGKCFVCLNRINHGVVQNFQHGKIAIGEFQGGNSPRVQELASLFAECQVRCAPSANLKETLWRKLVWNVPFNGLTIAAGNVDVSVIMQDEGLTQLTRELMKEVIDSAKSVEGLEIENSFIDEQLQLTSTMGPYKPSSLLDFRAGRPVEVEAIWGEPVRAAQAAGCEVPRMSMLYQLLREVTKPKALE